MMHKVTLWSLRLGYSANQTEKLKTLGLPSYLNKTMTAPYDKQLPAFLKDHPKNLIEISALRQQLNQLKTVTEKIAFREKFQQAGLLKIWWIDKIKADKNPLREKMVCFWHNHFVSTSKKVKLTYWLYEHHMLLQQHAFGNFKTMTKTMLKSNAMLRYLDNVDNKKGSINENLSRELLELFTLGIGNYTESDIKNGAKALAGLNFGNGIGIYRKRQQINEKITYLGKTGVFNSDDLVDIIFDQPSVPYLMTKKIIQWFLYDTPDQSMVQYYGDYFKAVNFEIKPLLIKLFTEEFEQNRSGSKIKDPLFFVLQLIHELGLEAIDTTKIALFIRGQGMDLFDQPNVKGWDGGRAWLSTQTYAERNTIIDVLTNSTIQLDGRAKMGENQQMTKRSTVLHPKVNLSASSNNQTKIITELANRLLFSTSKAAQSDMENVLKYDFDPQDEYADHAVLRLFNYIAKTPEYQLI